MVAWRFCESASTRSTAGTAVRSTIRINTLKFIRDLLLFPDAFAGVFVSGEVDPGKVDN
jgi:hypothetical protein